MPKHKNLGTQFNTDIRTLNKDCQKVNMNNKQQLKIWQPLLFALVMVVGMIIGYDLKGHTRADSFLASGQQSNLQEVINLINHKYVDAVSLDSMNTSVINQLVNHLDPHTVYITGKELSQVNEELTGHFKGVGIEYQMYNDTVTVIRVLPDGPSVKAGIQIGDQLITVDDSIALSGVNNSSESIRSKLRGAEGSVVKIKLIRNGKTLTIPITRGNINVPTVDVAYMIAPTIGFLRINKFGERTYEEFMQNMEALQKQKMESLILDLRGNGGGLMNEATKIADELLSDDKLIVYTEGKHAPRTEYRCKKDGLFEKCKLLVLIDEYAASASEVLTGALQDWDRATIIGRRSFGKGLVQQQYPLSDGGALRLTIARYYTPLGRNIQKPYNLGLQQYNSEVAQRFKAGEVWNKDSVKNVGISYKTPGGHVVYGGGGITPDIFIPFDTAQYNKSLSKLYYHSGLNTFAFSYYKQHLPTLTGVKSIAELEQAFHLTQQDFYTLQSIAKKDSVSILQLTDKETQQISSRTVALLARYVLGDSYYYQVLNKKDATVQKALEIINGKKQLPN